MLLPIHLIRNGPQFIMVVRGTVSGDSRGIATEEVTRRKAPKISGNWGYDSVRIVASGCLTSFKRSCCFEELPRRVFARPANALDGPAPSSGVQASLPVTRSRRDMYSAVQLACFTNVHAIVPKAATAPAPERPLRCLAYDRRSVQVTRSCCRRSCRSAACVCSWSRLSRVCPLWQHD